MGHFAAFEHHSGFQFAAFLQKFDPVPDFEIVIMFVNVQTELNFFDLLRCLVLFLVFQLFLLLVAELSEVHNFTDRRLACFSDQNEIQSRSFGGFACSCEFLHTQLFPFRANDQKIAVRESLII